MVSKGELIHHLYKVAEDLPVQYLAGAENALNELIARLQALNEGSSNPELGSVISLLLSAKEDTSNALTKVIGGQNGIGQHAGGL